MILKDYDLILIPGWINVEINDSKTRHNYIKQLIADDLPVFFIDEKDYEILFDYKTAYLYKLFLYSSYNIAEIRNYIKKTLSCKPIEDMDEYGIWLKKLYNEGFKGKKLKNGRMQKKNAGEISISVLAYILAYNYMRNLENITVFSNDRNTYDFIKRAEIACKNDKFFSQLNCKPITFKSNDLLTYDMYKKEKLDHAAVKNIIENYRSGKRIKFTRKKSDDSIEEQDMLISNDEFCQMIKDEFLHIIF